MDTIQEKGALERTARVFQMAQLHIKTTAELIQYAITRHIV